jgi:hypothetical protein
VASSHSQLLQAEPASDSSERNEHFGAWKGPGAAIMLSPQSGEMFIDALLKKGLSSEVGLSRRGL